MAKGVWTEDRSEYAELEVIKYVFDTNSIFTFQSMGGSVAVLLFVVDLSTEDVYFVCMNDYIDKLILPQYGNYNNQDTISITIPVRNNAFSFYGKRSKLLAAFSKFAYQKNEIGYLLGFRSYPVKTYREEIEKDSVYEPGAVKTQILYFIKQIEDLDIWEHTQWWPLPQAKADLITVKQLLADTEADWDMTIDKIIVLWHQLTNLGTMYEDLCCEWYLPKMISLLTSYPSQPDIIKITNDKNEK